MKRILFVVFCLLFIIVANAQNVSQQLAKAFAQFENDPQLKAAIASLYVIDNKTGKVVFEKNAGIGLAPASTQKVITSVTAYELLGKGFRYKTEFAIDKDNSSLYILPSGDPTLGSWRWESTKEKETLERITNALRKNLTTYNRIVFLNRGWDFEAIPDGWIWQDIGNYYGAGAAALNWRENQFDLILKSGKNIGDPVAVVRTEPELYAYKVLSAATAAAKGSGDNAYIYFPLNGGEGIVRGTIPVNETAFQVSGALPSPKGEFAALLENKLEGLGVKHKGQIASMTVNDKAENLKIIHTEESPSLDSIIYWLNRKSINLYAEALVKTIGYEKEQVGSTEKGVELVKNFWKEKGIQAVELNMVDGSGLSPLNRVTTKAQVQVLQYAKKQPWFSGFYLSLPEYNGMKMKSGTINNVKAFSGYQTSASGDYIFSFIVNNYNGSSASLVKKMYVVLNVLKK